MSRGGAAERHRSPLAGVLIVTGILAAAVILAILPLRVPLSFWVDIARVEVLILVLSGGLAAIAAGRDAYRVTLGTIVLIPAIALQCLFAFVVGGQGGRCGGDAVQYLVLALLVGAGILRQYTVAVVGPLVVAPAFAYGILARLTVLSRVFAVVGLLVALAGATVIAARYTATENATQRCVDF
jgi:hypothetical protein